MVVWPYYQAVGSTQSGFTVVKTLMRLEQPGIFSNVRYPDLVRHLRRSRERKLFGIVLSGTSEGILHELRALRALMPGNVAALVFSIECSLEASVHLLDDLGTVFSGVDMHFNIFQMSQKVPVIELVVVT